MQFTRTPPVIYYTKILHHVRHITPPKESDLLLTNAITRKDFPEASPRRPGIKNSWRSPGSA
jgi:hypothetical protein